MDIRALLFNSGTFNRADLNKKSEQELYNLWNASADKGDAQVIMYYLDEFSCAYNDEDVSPQDWLYFIDFDEVE